MLSGRECASQFEDAATSTLTAWHKTGLLSMTNGLRVERLEEAFRGGDPLVVSDLLADVSGRAYDAYASQSGLDADRAKKLGQILMRLLCADIQPAIGEMSVVSVIKAIHQKTKRWIELGSSMDDPLDLQKITKLVGDSPAVRLALVAPYAPALAACGVVARAAAARYPFTDKELPNGTSTNER